MSVQLQKNSWCSAVVCPSYVWGDIPGGSGRSVGIIGDGRNVRDGRHGGNNGRSRSWTVVSSNNYDYDDNDDHHINYHQLLIRTVAATAMTTHHHHTGHNRHQPAPTSCNDLLVVSPSTTQATPSANESLWLVGCFSHLSLDHASYNKHQRVLMTCWLLFTLLHRPHWLQQAPTSPCDSLVPFFTSPSTSHQQNTSLLGGTCHSLGSNPSWSKEASSSVQVWWPSTWAILVQVKISCSS